VLLAREQAHSLLFKTPKLFDNGQLLVILEGFFDHGHDFHICTRIFPRYSLCYGQYSHHSPCNAQYLNIYTRANVKITLTIEKSF